jgi:hypothetical protein
LNPSLLLTAPDHRADPLAQAFWTPQFPSIRPRCFGCSQPLALAEISRLILSCDRVLVQDLARSKTALAEFRTDPGRAREIAGEFVNRIGMNGGRDVTDPSFVADAKVWTSCAKFSQPTCLDTPRSLPVN